MEECVFVPQVIPSTTMTAVPVLSLMIARYGEFVTRSVKADLAITCATVKKGISWSVDNIAKLMIPLARPPLSSPMVGIC